MNMLDSYVYNVALDWTRGRSGTLAGPGATQIEFSAPPEFAGERGKWTPEHLLVAATASCFAATVMAIAEMHKLTFERFHVNAFARLEKLPGEGYRFTEMTLVPEVRVAPADVETALKVFHKAEKNCFVAKSLKATIQVEPRFISVDEEVMALQE